MTNPFEDARFCAALEKQLTISSERKSRQWRAAAVRSARKARLHGWKNPITSERIYTAEELEFLLAIESFKREHGGRPRSMGRSSRWPHNSDTPGMEGHGLMIAVRAKKIPQCKRPRGWERTAARPVCSSARVPIHSGSDWGGSGRPLDTIRLENGRP